MNLFELCNKINNPDEKKGWTETTAVFTGKNEKSAMGAKGHFQLTDVDEYEIRFNTEDGERTGWYKFSPLPGPDAADTEGKTIRIRYNDKKPWIFEAIPDDEDDPIS